MRSAFLDLVGQRCGVCRARPGPLCDVCADEMHPPANVPQVRGIDAVVAAWAYEGAARELILCLKLRAMRSAAAPLAAGMAQAARATGTPWGLVTWVPARPRDRRRRGFDHAELLAGHVAASLAIPARPTLARARDVPDQSGLTREARAANQAGLFAATCRLSGRVLLVDDLVTTGATASDCARALEAAGAPSVTLLVAARA